jgi:hypothetical protein
MALDSVCMNQLVQEPLPVFENAQHVVVSEITPARVRIKAAIPALAA